jgi:hypothetical protein
MAPAAGCASRVFTPPSFNLVAPIPAATNVIQFQEPTARFTLVERVTVLSFPSVPIM